LYDNASTFLTELALTELEQQLNRDIRSDLLYKVCPGLTPADSISISRQGESIRVPGSWRVFTLYFGESPIQDLDAAVNTLSNLDCIEYAVKNSVGLLESNDPLYPQQFYLNGGLSGLAQNSSINVGSAWLKTTGADTIRVGIFDNGVDWQHIDFGFDPLRPASGKVHGFDFFHNQDIRLAPDPTDNHGTLVTGIIGANRNNREGIAGIAGDNKMF
jgi:subtilisin family serine protease